MFNVTDAINVHVLQVPNNQNGNTAVVSASVILPDGRVITDIASCASSSPFDDGDSLGTAKAEVIQKIKQRVSRGQQQVEQPRQSKEQDHDKSKLNGGGNKPASKGQITFIRNKAEELGMRADKLAAARFGKTLQDLRGCEADSLIKELLNKAG